MTGLAIGFTILCLAFGTAYDILCQKERYRSAFWVKGLAGLCFIAVALALTMIQPQMEFPRWIVFGLVLGLIGDQLLALRRLQPERHDAFFALGMLAFAAGHVMYLIAMLQLDSGAWLFALVLLAFAYAAAAWYLMKRAVEELGIDFHATGIEHRAQQCVLFLYHLMEQYRHAEQLQCGHADELQPTSIADTLSHRNANAQTRV